MPRRPKQRTNRGTTVCRRALDSTSGEANDKLVAPFPPSSASQLAAWTTSTNQSSLEALSNCLKTTWAVAVPYVLFAFSATSPTRAYATSWEALVKALVNARPVLLQSANLHSGLSVLLDDYPTSLVTAPCKQHQQSLPSLYSYCIFFGNLT